MGSYGIKISQNYCREIRVSFSVVLENDLNKSLSLTIRISNVDSNLVSLLSLGIISINSGARREHDIVAVELLHHLQQRHRSTNVILVVFQGLRYALTNRLQTCKVNDTCNGAVVGENFSHKIFIANVALNKSDCFLVCTCNLVDFLNYSSLTVAQVIDDHDFVIPTSVLSLQDLHDSV